MKRINFYLLAASLLLSGCFNLIKDKKKDQGNSHQEDVIGNTTSVKKYKISEYESSLPICRIRSFSAVKASFNSNDINGDNFTIYSTPLDKESHRVTAPFLIDDYILRKTAFESFNQGDEPSLEISNDLLNSYQISSFNKQKVLYLKALKGIDSDIFQNGLSSVSGQIDINCNLPSDIDHIEEFNISIGTSDKEGRFVEIANVLLKENNGNMFRFSNLHGKRTTPDSRFASFLVSSQQNNFFDTIVEEEKEIVARINNYKFVANNNIYNYTEVLEGEVQSHSHFIFKENGAVEHKLIKKGLKIHDVLQALMNSSVRYDDKGRVTGAGILDNQISPSINLFSPNSTEMELVSFILGNNRSVFDKIDNEIYMFGRYSVYDLHRSLSSKEIVSIFNDSKNISLSIKDKSSLKIYISNAMIHNTKEFAKKGNLQVVCKEEYCEGDYPNERCQIDEVDKNVEVDIFFQNEEVVSVTSSNELWKHLKLSINRIQISLTDIKDSYYKKDTMDRIFLHIPLESFKGNTHEISLSLDNIKEKQKSGPFFQDSDSCWYNDYWNPINEYREFSNYVSGEVIFIAS